MNNLAKSIKPESEKAAYIQLLMYRRYGRQKDMGKYIGSATRSVGNYGADDPVYSTDCKEAKEMMREPVQTEKEHN